MSLALAAALLAGEPGSYATVNGVRTYYEAHGNGPVLLLLHGGGGTLEDMRPLVEAARGRYRVIAPERMGHGRTAEAQGRPFRYSGMADDTLELLRQLHVTRVYAVGWSDGGVIGLDLAMRHPELVDRLVAIGANARPDGVVTTPEALRAAGPQRWRDWMKANQARLSGDPGRYAALQERMRAMWEGEPTYSAADLGRIRCPTLLVVGDRDLVPVAHAAEMQRQIAESRLLVVPGASHFVALEQPALVNDVILSFLAGR